MVHAAFTALKPEKSKIAPSCLAVKAPEKLFTMPFEEIVTHQCGHGLNNRTVPLAEDDYGFATFVLAACCVCKWRRDNSI